MRPSRKAVAFRRRSFTAVCFAFTTTAFSQHQGVLATLPTLLSAITYMLFGAAFALMLLDVLSVPKHSVSHEKRPLRDGYMPPPDGPTPKPPLAPPRPPGEGYSAVSAPKHPAPPQGGTGITEGKVKKGGQNDPPTTPRPEPLRGQG